MLQNLIDFFYYIHDEKKLFNPHYYKFKYYYEYILDNRTYTKPQYNVIPNSQNYNNELITCDLLFEEALNNIII